MPASDRPEYVLCRRFPPTLNMAVQQWQFPVMHNGGWCGEHKPKAEKE
jgi:hypothetical protein